MHNDSRTNQNTTRYTVLVLLFHLARGTISFKIIGPTMAT